MALPLYLALTAAEISAQPCLPASLAYMACSFSPYSMGLTGIPAKLPAGCMLILNDRMDCQGHSPDLVAGQLQDAVEQLGCESVLLDFQRTPEPESEAMVRKIIHTLSCPVAVTEAFAARLDCPVFLSPAPLHIPIEAHLSSWQGREIWLEAALGQLELRVTPEGISAVSQFPPEGLTDGFYEETLCCHYKAKIDAEHITFTLFDTPKDLKKKLELAASLGVTRAIGLWQELGTFQSGTEHEYGSIAPTEKPC